MKATTIEADSNHEQVRNLAENTNDMRENNMTEKTENYSEKTREDLRFLIGTELIELKALVEQEIERRLIEES